MEVYNLKSKKTLILVFALAMIATACSSAAVPCDEVEIGTGSNGLPDLDGCEFTFAVENAYLPFNYVDPADGEAKGWDYDVFNHMAELMNFTPVYVPAAWDGMIQAVADGQYMIAGDGISITAERDNIVDFSDSYIVFQQRILVAAGNDDITSDADIVNGDGKVATQKGTTNYELAVSLFGEDKVDAYDTFDFAKALKTTKLVVNESSNPAMEATINGIPAWTGPDSLTYPVSVHPSNLKDKLPDREEWLVKLCHTEWTVDEIAKGIPWLRLLNSLLKYRPSNLEVNFCY